MSLMDGTLKLCNCNKTMAMDARAVAKALDLVERAAGAFANSAGRRSAASRPRSATTPAWSRARRRRRCSPRSPRSAGGRAVLRFVNIRETAGWSREGRDAAPKMAACSPWPRCPSPNRCRASRSSPAVSC